jgi:hypothetical protein
LLFEATLRAALGPTLQESNWNMSGPVASVPSSAGDVAESRPLPASVTPRTIARRGAGRRAVCNRYIVVVVIVVAE